MTGGSAASAGSGTSSGAPPASEGVGEAPVVDGGEVTSTEDVPLPISPYALVAPRRKCFEDGYNRCRR